MSGLEAAVAAVRSGLIVGLPTDTVYGVAIGLGDRSALDKLHALKGRAADHPIALLAPDLESAQLLGVFSPAAAKLATMHWPGPLTLVVDRSPSLPEWVGDQTQRTVGLRVPAHPAALALLGRTGTLAVTSANATGDPPAMSSEEAEAIFGGGVAVYVDGKATGGRSSTVVRVHPDRLELLRAGPVAL